MRSAFTICSNNYLAQAKTLADSFILMNPSYRFIIFLVDTLSEKIDYHFFDPYEIVPVMNMGIEQLDQMIERYDITELNTAIKPFAFHFLFNRDPKADYIIYSDPDIYFYRPITLIENQLLENDILLTPHIFSPIYDKLSPSEPDFLNAGLYNLGFLAMKRSGESAKFLNWWMLKLTDQCRIDFANGLFVDQLWINFAPLYFNNVHILRHLGHNVAYWNLHEREITMAGNRYMINNVYDLIFFHFSGYHLSRPGNISKYQNRFRFSTRADISGLFKKYQQCVVKNNYAQYIQVPCHYYNKKQHSNIKSQTSNYTFLERIRFFCIHIIDRVR